MSRTMFHKLALVAIMMSISIVGIAGRAHAQPTPPPQPGFAPGEPTPGQPAPPPKDGTRRITGCDKVSLGVDDVTEKLLSIFDTAEDRVATLKCIKTLEPDPTQEQNPDGTAKEPKKKDIIKVLVDVGWKEDHITMMKASLDPFQIESVPCSPQIAKAVLTRLGPSPRSLDGSAPPALRCMPDSGRTLRVYIPGKAVARIKIDGTFLGMVAGNDDIHESGSVLMALLFWAFAAATIGGAVFVITRRNLIAAVMGMVGSFLGIAAIYMMLYAQFLAVIQMLVYAGAIMVLFVFVIMILNRPEDEPIAPTGRAGQTLGIISIVYLVYRLSSILIHVRAPNGEASLAAPAPLPVPAPGTGVHEWGTLKAVGTDLFGNGLFPFETISILLLIAVVGAIAIARPLKDDEP